MTTAISHIRTDYWLVAVDDDLARGYALFAG